MSTRGVALILGVAVLGYAIGAGAVAVETGDDIAVKIHPDRLAPGSGDVEIPPSGGGANGTKTTTQTNGDTTSEPLSSATTTSSSATTTSTGQELDRARVEQLVHEYINRERSERGLSNLSFDNQLRKIARSHSTDMAERGYFSHTSPEGETMQDRYEAHDYECRVTVSEDRYATGAENLAYTYAHQRVETKYDGTVYHRTARDVADGLVQQWMHSEGHRENILTTHWENEGIGVSIVPQDGGSLKIIATQNFC